MTAEINGEVHRSFVFPTEVTTAIAFYSKLERMLDWLPHISMVQKYGENQHRMMFHSTELGIYQVKIYCDLEAVPELASQVLYVKPINGFSPVMPKADLYSIVAHGIFTSESIFRAVGNHTKVHYHLKLQSELPIPLAARLIFPARVVDFIAHSIMVRRMNEIAEGFIERSLAAYQQQKLIGTPSGEFSG